MTFNAASRLRSLEDRSAALGSRRCELPDICSLAIRLWGWRPEPEALKYVYIFRGLQRGSATKGASKDMA